MSTIIRRAEGRVSFVRGPGRMVLGALANRRSARVRLAAGTAIVATLFGPLSMAHGGLTGVAAPPAAGTGALPDDHPRRSSDRIRPVMVTDLAGKLSADVLWRLFDGDARTGLAAAQPVKVRLTFASAITVDAVGAYGSPAGVLSVLGPEGATAGGPSMDLGAAGQPWKRMVVPDGPAARSLVVQWAPRSADAVLPELEIWGRGSGRLASSVGPDLEEALYSGLPDGAETYADESRTGERLISAATPLAARTFAVSLPMDRASIARAFLVYDLADLPHFTATRRSINGGPVVGGFGVSLGAKGGLAVEEIPPATLRRGTNTIRFDPASPTNPAGYRVNHLRLVVTHASSARAAADGPDLEDGKEATGWAGGQGSARTWRFAGPTQPRELELRLAKGEEGTLVVVAGAAGGDRNQVKVDLAALKPGWHKVALEALPPVETLTMALAGGKEGTLFVSELTVTGSPLPAPAERRFRVTYPLHGECVNHQVHVRGLVTPAPDELRANGAPVRDARLEPGGFSFTAADRDLGGGAGKPFHFTVEAVDHGGGSAARARAEIAVEGCLDRPAVVAGRFVPVPGPAEDAGAPYGVVVTPDRPATLAFGGAKLEVPAGAVTESVRLTIRPLEAAKVPTLDSGMTNVTVGGGAFRLGPRGMKFQKPVGLTLPVDRSRADPEESVRAFYFDEKESGWREVNMRGERGGDILAETTHFTDFIAANLKLPEHPGIQSMNPTSLKDIKVADPAAGVELMAPPEPNSQGTANLSYPIEVPPGRRGMQPQLAINYDSSAGNGWLGTGWSLDTSSVEIDTRFGVPRYDGSETYALDGQMLTPATSAPSGAPAGTYYWRRREGRFDWIQRVTQSTGVYYWVVTDKTGMKFTYGQADQARLMPKNGTTPDRTRTFKWFLEKAEDIYGNQVLYTYSADSGNNGDPWVQLYPSKVTYTATASGTPAAAYSVVFTLQTAARADAFSSGRSGFQVLTRKLLDSVDVKNGTSIVRRYKLAYVTGDFGKSLLQTISVFGKGPTTTAIAQHTLDYYQVPRDASNNPRIFGTPRSTGYTTLINPNDNSGASYTGLRNSRSVTGSWGLNVGVASGSHTEIDNFTDEYVEDIDGDGLPDWLPNYNFGNKQSMSIQPDGSAQGLMSVFNYNIIAPYDKDITNYLSSTYDIVGISGGEDYGNISETVYTRADMTGDGIPDYVSVSGDTLYVTPTKPHNAGFEPFQTWTGYKKTGLKFDCSDVFSNSNTLAFNGSQASFPSVDIITKWVAPFSGDIRITGEATRQESGGDGMIASMYLGNALIWEREFAPDDMAPCTPAQGVPDPGTTCDFSEGGTVGIVKHVNAGDRVYTRVNAKGNTDHDVLRWDLTVRYLNEPVPEEQRSVEAWGPLRYVWSEVAQQRVTGQFYKPWVNVSAGDNFDAAATIKFDLQTTKQPTTDNVRVHAELYRPSNGASFPLVDKTYLSTDTPTNEVITVNNAATLKGDEIHVWVQSESDLPIDPDRVRVLSLVTYNTFCRNNPYTGTVYCGTPQCSPVQTEQGALPGTMCTIETQSMPGGGSSDPLAAQKVPGSIIKQIAATYMPLQKWIFQPRFTPSVPATTIDGRQAQRTTVSNPTLKFCYQSTDPALQNESFTLAIQGVNKLFKKGVYAGVTGEISPCLVATNTGLAANDQVFFSMYSERPFPAGVMNVTAFINNTQVPLNAIERYYRDTSKPIIDHFPFVGRAETMAGGFRDLFMGTWNGNKDFDESFITVTPPNTTYAPLWNAPIPADAVSQGNLGFLDGLVDFLSDVWGAISGAATYIWDSAVGAAKIVGSTCIKGIRALGSIAGKIMAWAVCELGDESYEAVGVRYSETHSSQKGFDVGISSSDSSSIGGLDLMDMNGDQIPDQVSTVGIRYGIYDRAAKTGKFCTRLPDCPDTPVVTIPGQKLRDVSHFMNTASIGAGVTADAQAADSMVFTKGVQLQISASDRVSQGYSHMNRDLRDVNGDGLPDVVDANGYGLTVRLNYGYGFGNPITWTSPAWAVTSPQSNSLLAGGVIDSMILAIAQYIQSHNPPTSATLRLEEEGHKGGSVGVGTGVGSLGYGLDQTYERTLVDLVDVNGDGLPDQVMKLPGDKFRVKLNMGTSFGAEFQVQADAWPALDALFAPTFTSLHVDISKADTLTFEHGDSYDFNVGVLVGGETVGEGNRKSILTFMDIDGDGRLDHVLKNADVTLSESPNAPMYVRLNQTGKSNLLSKVTRPLGGTIELDYQRSGNVSGTFTGIDGVTQDLDTPTARWTLSRMTVTDGRGNRYTDQIDNRIAVTDGPSPASGFYDRNEREFYGYSRLYVRHGIAGPNGTTIEGDGSVKYRYFLNQSYNERGLLLAEYDIDADGSVLRGSVTQSNLSNTTGTTAGTSMFVQGTTTLDLVYEGTLRDVDLFASNPAAVFDLPEFIPDAPVFHQTNRAWDPQGNLTTVADFGDPFNTADDIMYGLQYATFSGQRFTALSQVLATSPTDLTVPFAKRNALWVLNSNRPQMTQLTDTIYGGQQPGTGTPYNGTASTTTLTYDQAQGNFGNLRTITDPTGYTQTLTYDTATSTHVTNVKDSLNYQSSSTINMDFGLPATTTDVNGKVVTYNYDSYGRISKVWGPTDPTSGQATVQMTYSQAGSTTASVPWARSQHKDFQSTTGDTIDTINFIDGLGRTIQTKKEAEVLQTNGTTVAGFSVSGLVVFDAHGRVLAQHQPIFDSTTAATTLVAAPQKNPTIYTYDGLGRPKLVSLPDGNARSNRYYIAQPNDTSDDGLPGAGRALAASAATDENGHVRRTYADGNGRTVATKMIHFPIAGVEIMKSTYEYDPLGHLTRVTDLNGNDAAKATYDSLGHMVSSWMADTGTTTLRYNVAGQLAEEQTAKLAAAGQVIKYTYEQNRLKTIDYPTTSDVTYDYGLSTETGDTNGNRAGRIKTVTMEGGTEQRSYDAFGNVSQTVTTLKHINNTTLTSPVVTMKYSYDWLGRMRTMTFPKVVDQSWNIATGDGEVITYTYDKGGMLDKISGKATPTSTAENYLNDVGYDEFGARKRLVSGNTIINDYGYDVRRRLSSINATARPTSGAVQFHALSYVYDPAGNITQITNNPPQSAIRPDTSPVGVGPLEQNYWYDDIDRLEGSNGHYRGHATFGYHYSNDFQYDAWQNIKQKAQGHYREKYKASDVGFANAQFDRFITSNNYTLQYFYAQDGDGHHVHIADPITETGSDGIARSRTVSVDANGNNTGDSFQGTTRTNTWDEANRLKQTSMNNVVNGRYLYNPDGERTQKQDSSGNTTFYFNQFLVIHGNKTMTKHLYAGETRIVSKTESSQSATVRHFYHPDHLGSTSYITDSNQNFVQHERYFPYGERWAEPAAEEQATGSLRRDWLFTSKEMDRDTGLYYYGARYIDPRSSQWLSADPMMGSYMTGGGFFGQQNLGIYSYAWNNPVAMRDPDGRVVGSVNTREQAEAIKQAEAAEVRMAQDAWDRAGRAMARGGGLGVARAFWETNHGHPEVGNNLIGGIRFVGQEAIAETEITAEHFPMGLYQGMTWAAVGGVGEFIMGEMLGAAVGASTTGGGGGRMIRGFHGTTGDNVLGILDTGGFVPKNGRTFLSEGVGDTFKFGADLSRRASFSIEVEVPEGAASVLRIATPGVPRTLVLRSQSTIPANVLRLFVRRPDGAGGFTTEIIEKAAIRAYLSP